MAFPVHGESTVTHTGQIVLAEVEGPWNLELIRLYRKQMAAVIPAVEKQGAWVLVVRLHRTAICPMDAIDLIRQGIAQDADSHRVATCYVMTPQLEGYLIMKPVWRKLYEGLMPFEVFESLEDAQQWAEQMLDLSAQA